MTHMPSMLTLLKSVQEIQYMLIIFMFEKQIYKAVEFLSVRFRLWRFPVKPKKLKLSKMCILFL